MKHKLIIVLSLMAIIALSFYALVKYDRYRDNQRKLNLANQIYNSNAVQKEASRVAAETAEKAKLEAACLQGKKAYDQLTAVQKAKILVPNCDLSQVQ